MAEAKSRENWNHTSTVLAMIANVNRDPKKSRAFRPDDFNPYAARLKQGVPLTAGNVRMLKTIFVDKTGRSES